MGGPPRGPGGGSARAWHRPVGGIVATAHGCPLSVQFGRYGAGRALPRGSAMPVLLSLTPGDGRAGRGDARDRAAATMAALAPMTRITHVDVPAGTTAAV